MKFADEKLEFANDLIKIEYSLRSEKFKNGVITVENFVPVSVSDEKLAFDHDQIILEGLMRIRNKAEYTGIMFNLVPREFTIPDLLKVFEVLSGKEVHPKVFREKIQEIGRAHV